MAPFWWDHGMSFAALPQHSAVSLRLTVPRVKIFRRLCLLIAPKWTMNWEESPRRSLGINKESLAGKAEPYRTVLRQSRKA